MKDDDMAIMGPNDMIGGVPADEVRALRVLIRHEGDKTYVGATNGDPTSLERAWFDVCLSDLIQEGLRNGRKLSKVLRRHEDAYGTRREVIIAWEP